MSEYIEKVISGTKPFWSAIVTVVTFVMFPNGAYLYSAFALAGAMVLDIITKYWALSKKAGGYRKAVQTRTIFSATFWLKTSIKLKTYLVVAILSGLAYRVTFLEQIGVFLGTFAYTMMFLREAQSILENLEDAGGDVGWLIKWTKKKQDRVMDDEGIKEEKEDGEIDGD